MYLICVHHDLLFITGGVAQVGLNLTALSEFISHHKEKNHLYVLENMLREMLPPYAVSKCDLSMSLTDKGNVSLILEAVNPGDTQMCQGAILGITNAIKNGFVHDAPRNFEMAAFLNVDSWFRDQVIGLQDRITDTADDLSNQANVKLDGTLLTLDDKIQRLPSKGHTTRHFITTITSSMLLLFHALH